MKKLLLLITLIVALFAGSATAATAATVAPAPTVSPSMTTDPSGGGLGICGPSNFGYFTVTRYGIGMVDRINNYGTLLGYNYRWATTRWLCSYFGGNTVWNFITGGISIFQGYAWWAYDVHDRVYV